MADFSDPFNPRSWSYSFFESCCNVYVDEDNLFLVERDRDARGIRIIDNSDPRHLRQVGFYPLDDPLEIVASGDYCYIRVRDGYQIVDISDPAQPQFAGSFQNLTGKMTISGDYLYIAAGEDGIVVIDVSDPEAPEQYGYYDTAGMAERIAVDGDLIYVADQTQVGIYRLEPSDRISKLTDAVPSEFNLFPPRPNPFNSITTIRYGLPYPGNISLQVYNHSGQQITTLFEGNRQASIHTSILTASDLPSGLYFLRLDYTTLIKGGARGDSRVQKVMLIR